MMIKTRADAVPGRAFRTAFVLAFFCLLALIAAGLSGSLHVKAAEETVRVGLAELYSGKSSIVVKNSSLTAGYSLKGGFVTETLLKSPGGFSFEPATGFFYLCNTEFGSFAAAREQAEKILNAGGKAYPCTVYPGTWLLYTGGGTKDEAGACRDIAVAATGLSFDTASADNGNRIKITCDEGEILADAGIMGVYPQFEAAAANPDGDYVIALPERTYRGRIEIGRYGKGSLTAVNEVELEKYLYSVVNCEMSASWPFEAMKAQAVCARSYAVARQRQGSISLSNPYILDDTTRSQVYKGYGYETESSKRAVKATDGETVTKNGETVTAFFFSTSGGATENIEDVWGYNADYLRSVPDLYETSPEVLPWVVVISGEKISTLLAANGKNIGKVADVTVYESSGAGRVKKLKITGSAGSAILETDEIRNIFDLWSTKFTVTRGGETPPPVYAAARYGTESITINESYVLDGTGEVKAAPEIQQYIAISDSNLTGFLGDVYVPQGSFAFAGMGWGHGVGLSQSGAKGLAEAGFDYKEIVEYYYTGCVVR